MSFKISHLGFWLFWTDHQGVSFLPCYNLSPFRDLTHTLHLFLTFLVCYLEYIHYVAHKVGSTL